MQFIVVLDNIRSAYNVGSIFRTADAFGVKKLYLCGMTAAPDNGESIKKIGKTALGAEQSVAWEYHQSTIEVINKLKTEDYLIIALEQTPVSKNLLDFTKSYQLTAKSLALTVGHELSGVSEAVLALADHIVEIPMLGQKESLNVSVAFGIAAFMIDQLKPSSIDG